MIVTKVLCDRCRKEIEGDPVKIIPELNGEVLAKKQEEKDYCMNCFDKAMAFLNGMAPDSEFEAAVESMTAGDDTGMAEKPAAKEKKTGVKRKKGNPTMKQQILEQVAQGASLKEIAERMGKTYGYVWQVVNRDKKNHAKAELIQQDKKKTVCCTDEVKKKCAYGNTNGAPSCDFINIIGHSRGCDPERCTEFVKSKRGGSRNGRINNSD